MSSIGAISGHVGQVSNQQINQQQPRPVDQDHDGDNDATEPKATQATEAGPNPQKVDILA